MTPRICIVLSAGFLSVQGQTLLVLPYVQPGPTPATGRDSATLLWMTDARGDTFTATYSVDGTVTTASVTRTEIQFPGFKPKAGKKEITSADRIAESGQHYQRYESVLPDLPLDARVTYQVNASTGLVRSATFATRASGSKTVRGIFVGDIAKGLPAQDLVARQIAATDPSFMVVLGDIVYPEGRVSEYMDHFWRTYNRPGPGAPLMATIPFYAVLGNHDVDVHNLRTVPDALGAYYFFRTPANGPGEGPWNTPLGIGAEVDAFRAAVGPAYPSLGLYSFDQGPLHVVCIDNSGYANPSDPRLLAWLENDLGKTRQPWKIVCLHGPLFQSSLDHYTEQKSRLLAPLFEKAGVSLVFSGHVHNYQRSVPLRFTPNPARRQAHGGVNGDFKLDTVYDGREHTVPDGVVYIVSGGGGANLYPVDPIRNGEVIADKYPGNHVPYTAAFNCQVNSFCVLEASPNRLELCAIDSKGGALDRIVLTPRQAVPATDSTLLPGSP